MISISSLQIISDTLFIFLLGTFLINTKVGLLATLLLEVANSHIHFGYWTIPNTLAATLITPIIYILFKLRKDNQFIGTFVVILLMGTLILTHTITAMCLALILFVLWSTSEVYTILFQEKKSHRIVTTNLSVLFSVGMLAYWSYASGHIMKLANLLKWGFRMNLINTTYQYLNDIPLVEQTFNTLGGFLFFSLSFIGYLYMTSKQFRNKNRFLYIISGMLILCISFISLLSKTYIIVGRWDYFSQILSVIPLSLSLFLINGIFKNQFIKGVLMSLLVFTLSFLLIISPLANNDNHLFSPNSGVRHAFTDSELKAMNTISRIWNGTIVGDQLSKGPYELQYNQEFLGLGNSIPAEYFTNIEDVLFLVREEMLTPPHSLQRGIIKLKYDLNVALDNQKLYHIYNSGSTSGYLIP